MSSSTLSRLIDNANAITKLVERHTARISADIGNDDMPMEVDIQALESAERQFDAYMDLWRLGVVGAMYGTLIKTLEDHFRRKPEVDRDTVKYILKQMGIPVPPDAADLTKTLSVALTREAPLSWHREVIHQIEMAYGV